MLRFVTYALPLLILLLALFGLAVEMLDVEPSRGSVIKLALLDQEALPAQLVFGTWLVEASGLLALFLLAQGRCGTWWLDGLVAGWLGWIFRGPLLVVTIVVAARQPHHAWWTLAFGWWVLYSVCGLALAILARRTELDLAVGASGAEQRHEKLAEQRRAELRRAEALATQPVPVEKPVDSDDAEARDSEEPAADDATPDESESEAESEPEAPTTLETQPITVVHPDELPEREASAESEAEDASTDDPDDDADPDAHRSPWEKPRPGEDA